MIPTAHGFAVIAAGKIEVATIQDSRIGAIVNWLITNKKIVVMAGVDDAMIETAWQRFKGDAEVEEVTITRKARA